MRAKFDERKLKILDFLEHNPGSDSMRVKVAMQTTWGSTTATLSRLSKQGLVSRKRETLKPSMGRSSPPRWRYCYYISDLGKKRKNFLKNFFLKKKEIKQDK